MEKEWMEKEWNEKGISLKGFFVLHRRCIELMKISICWVKFYATKFLIAFYKFQSILRHFGYEDNLSLKSHFFKDEDDEFK